MSFCGDTDDGPAPYRTHPPFIHSTPTNHRTARQTIEAVVAEELAGWSVHEKVHVSYAELHDALLRIRRRLEGPRGITTGELSLLRFVVGARWLCFWHGWLGRSRGLGGEACCSVSCILRLPPSWHDTDMEAKEGEEAGLGGVEGGAILYEMVNETWDAVERWVRVIAIFMCAPERPSLGWDDMTVVHRTRAHHLSHPPPQQPNNQNPQRELQAGGGGLPGRLLPRLPRGSLFRPLRRVRDRRFCRRAGGGDGDGEGGGGGGGRRRAGDGAGLAAGGACVLLVYVEYV